MGPPRVIGGYIATSVCESSRLPRFNGAAESNRRIREGRVAQRHRRADASMGPPRVIGGYPLGFGVIEDDLDMLQWGRRE